MSAINTATPTSGCDWPQLPEHADALRTAGEAVSRPAHRAYPFPGKLGNATPDTMTLHTREALQLFNGEEPARKSAPLLLAGGRHFASAVRSIWRLCGNDNPYADWLLLRLYSDLATLRATIAGRSAELETAIDEVQRKGLSFAVMASASPSTVTLVFRSPYGYAVAEAIAEFDYCARLTQTLVYRDRLARSEGSAQIRLLSNALFALFLKALRWKNLLQREDLRGLHRGDFAPGAGEAALLRVALATRFFGRLPERVLEGSELPRHVRRRVQRGTAMPVAVARLSASALEPSQEGGASAFAEQCAGLAGDVFRETHGARIHEGQEQQGGGMTGQFDQPVGDKHVESV